MLHRASYRITVHYRRGFFYLPRITLQLAAMPLDGRITLRVAGPKKKP
jgi:hypothetical protein